MSKNANNQKSSDRQTSSGWVEVLQWRWFPWLVLPLIWALAYLPQLNARDLRHEEGRRATPAAEMLRSSNWLTPTIYGEPYLNKPPLYFWIVAGLGRWQGQVTALSTRLPSAISALLGAWLVIGFGTSALPRHTRALAALLLLSMPVMLDKATLGEIDAFLSMLTFASFAALWAAYDARRGRIALWGWFLSGAAMGLAVLAKGPGGPIEFYAIFLAFTLLAGRGRWKLLFAPGHFLMIALAATPMVCWAAMMMAQAKLGASTVGSQWADQLGLGAFFPAASQFAQERQANPPVLPHYLWFWFEVLTMMLPWSLLAIAPAFPAFARRAGWIAAPPPASAPPAPLTSATHSLQPAGFRPGPEMRDLWILLAVSGPALTAAFWLWPMAKPRHMMMIAFPVSVLVALTLATQPAAAPQRQVMAALAALARILASAIAVIAVAGVIAAIVLCRPAIPVTCIVAAAAILLSVLSFRWSSRTPLESAPLALGANLALLILLGWGVAVSVVFPYAASRDSTRRLHQQIERIVPVQYPPLPVYTTRSLLSGKGDNYFNAQFYLPGGVHALSDFSQLLTEQPGKTVTVILAPDEWPSLRAVVPSATKLGELYTPKGPPRLWVARALIPPRNKT